MKPFKSFDDLVDAVTTSAMEQWQTIERTARAAGYQPPDAQHLSGFTQADPRGYWLAEFQLPDNVTMRLEPAVNNLHVVEHNTMTVRIFDPTGYVIASISPSEQTPDQN